MDCNSIDTLLFEMINNQFCYEKDLKEILIKKLQHIQSGATDIQIILRHIYIFHKEKRCLFFDEDIQIIVKQLFISSSKSVKRVSNRSESPLAILAIKIFSDILKDELNWSLDFLRIYLEDALGVREWVDGESLETKYMCDNILEWAKIVGKAESGSFHDCGDRTQKRVTDPESSKYSSVCDRFSNFHAEAQAMVLEMLRQRIISHGILLPTESPRASTSSHNTASSPSSSASSSWTLVKTISTFSYLQSVRLIAAQCLEKWFNNPALADDLHDLIQNIAVHIANNIFNDSICPADLRIIEIMNDLRVRLRMKASQLESFRLLTLTVGCKGPHIAAIILRMLISSDICGNISSISLESVKQETIKFVISLLSLFNSSSSMPTQSHVLPTVPESTESQSLRSTPVGAVHTHTNLNVLHSSDQSRRLFPNNGNGSKNEVNGDTSSLDIADGVDVLGHTVNLLITQALVARKWSAGFGKILLDMIVRVLRTRNLVVHDVVKLVRIVVRPTQTHVAPQHSSGLSSTSVGTEMCLEKDILRFMTELSVTLQLLVAHEVLVLEKGIKDSSTQSNKLRNIMHSSIPTSTSTSSTIGSSDLLAQSIAPSITESQETPGSAQGGGRGRLSGGGRQVGRGRGGVASALALSSQMFRGSGQSSGNTARGRGGGTGTGNTQGSVQSIRKPVIDVCESADGIFAGVSLHSTITPTASSTNSNAGTEMKTRTGPHDKTELFSTEMINQRIKNDNDRVLALRQAAVQVQVAVVQLLSDVMNRHGRVIVISLLESDSGLPQDTSHTSLIWIKWLSKVLSFELTSLNKVAVEIENLAPFKCRDHGCLTGDLLYAVAELIRLSATHWDEILSGIDILERLVERALMTPPGSESTMTTTPVSLEQRRYGLFVDDVNVILQLFRLCQVVPIETGSHTDSDEESKKENYVRQRQSSLSMQHLKGAKEELAKSTAHVEHTRTPDDSVLNIPLEMPWPSDSNQVSSLCRSISVDSTASTNQPEIDIPMDRSLSEDSDTRSNGEYEVPMEVGVSSSVSQGSLKRATIDNFSSSKLDIASSKTMDITSRLEIITPPLGHREIYWKVCVVCFSLGCALPATVGTFLWDSIPTVRALMMMAISGRFFYPPTVESVMTVVTVGGFSSSTQSLTNPNVDLPHESDIEGSMVETRLRQLPISGSHLGFGLDFVTLTEFGLECERCKPLVVESVVKEAEAIIWGELFSEGAGKIVAKSMSKLMNANEKKQQMKFTSAIAITKGSLREGEDDDIDDDIDGDPDGDAYDRGHHITSVSRSGRVRKMRYHIADLIQHGTKYYDDSDIQDSVRVGRRHSARSEKRIAVTKLESNIEISKFPPPLTTHLGDIMASDLTLLAVYNVPRSPPEDIVSQIGNLDRKYKFGDILRKSKEPDFIVRAVLGESSASVSTSACVSRELIDQSAAWLIPSISVDINSVLIRIPLIAIAHLTFMISLGVYKRFQSYQVWDDEFRGNDLDLASDDMISHDHIEMITTENVLDFGSGKALARVLCESPAHKQDIKLLIALLQKLHYQFHQNDTKFESEPSKITSHEQSYPSDIDHHSELQDIFRVISHELGSVDTDRRHSARLALACLASVDPIDITSSDNNSDKMDSIIRSINKIILIGPVKCDFEIFFIKMMDVTRDESSIGVDIRKVQLLKMFVNGIRAAVVSEDDVEVIERYFNILLQHGYLLHTSDDMYETISSNNDNNSYNDVTKSKNMEVNWHITACCLLELFSSHPQMSYTFLTSYNSDLFVSLLEYIVDRCKIEQQQQNHIYLISYDNKDIIDSSEHVIKMSPWNPVNLNNLDPTSYSIANGSNITSVHATSPCHLNSKSNAVYISRHSCRALMQITSFCMQDWQDDVYVSDNAMHLTTESNLNLKTFVNSNPSYRIKSETLFKSILSITKSILEHTSAQDLLQHCQDILMGFRFCDYIRRDADIINAVPTRNFLEIFFYEGACHSVEFFKIALESLDMRLKDGGDYEFSLLLDEIGKSEDQFINICKFTMLETMCVFDDVVLHSAYLTSKLNLARYDVEVEVDVTVEKQQSQNEDLIDSTFQNSTRARTTESITDEVNSSMTSQDNAPMDVEMSSDVSTQSHWNELSKMIRNGDVLEAIHCIEILVEKLTFSSSSKVLDEIPIVGDTHGMTYDDQLTEVREYVTGFLISVCTSCNITEQMLAVDLMTILCVDVGAADVLIRVSMQESSLPLLMRSQLLLPLVTLNPINDVAKLKSIFAKHNVSSDTAPLQLILIIPALRMSITRLKISVTRSTSDNQNSTHLPSHESSSDPYLTSLNGYKQREKSAILSTVAELDNISQDELVTVLVAAFPCLIAILKLTTCEDTRDLVPNMARLLLYPAESEWREDVCGERPVCLSVGVLVAETHRLIELLVQLDPLLASSWAFHCLPDLLPASSVVAAAVVKPSKTKRSLVSNKQHIGENTALCLRPLVFRAYETYPQEVLVRVNDWCCKNFSTWSVESQTFEDSTHVESSLLSEYTPYILSSQDALCLFHLAMLTARSEITLSACEYPLKDTESEKNPETFQKCEVCGDHVSGGLRMNMSCVSSAEHSSSFCCCIFCGTNSGRYHGLDEAIFAALLQLSRGDDKETVRVLHRVPSGSTTTSVAPEVLGDYGQEEGPDGVTKACRILQYVASNHPVLWLQYCTPWLRELIRSLHLQEQEQAGLGVCMDDVSTCAGEDSHRFIALAAQSVVGDASDTSKMVSYKLQFSIPGQWIRRMPLWECLLASLKLIPAAIIHLESSRSTELTSMLNFLKDFACIRQALTAAASRAPASSVHGRRADDMAAFDRVLQDTLQEMNNLDRTGSVDLSFFKSVLRPVAVGMFGVE